MPRNRGSSRPSRSGDTVSWPASHGANPAPPSAPTDRTGGLAASAHISDYDTRLRAIGQAFDERKGTVPLLNVDPMVDDLRSNPEFSSLIARLGLPDGARLVKPS
jgi:hypothetical protein